MSALADALEEAGVKFSVATAFVLLLEDHIAEQRALSSTQRFAVVSAARKALQEGEEMLNDCVAAAHEAARAAPSVASGMGRKRGRVRR